MDPVFGEIARLFGADYPPPRAEIKQAVAGEIRVTIPALRSWFQRIFSGIWLVGFGATLVVTPVELMLHGPQRPATGQIPPSPLFLVAGFVFLSLLAASLLYAWFWNVAGREVVTLDSETLIIARFIGKRRVHFQSAPRASVRRFSVSPPAVGRFGFFRDRTQAGMLGYSLQPADITVTANERTLSFGLSLNETEARRLAALFNDQLARFGETSRAAPPSR